MPSTHLGPTCLTQFVQRSPWARDGGWRPTEEAGRSPGVLFQAALGPAAAARTRRRSAELPPWRWRSVRHRESTLSGERTRPEGEGWLPAAAASSSARRIARSTSGRTSGAANPRFRFAAWAFRCGMMSTSSRRRSTDGPVRPWLPRSPNSRRLRRRSETSRVSSSTRPRLFFPCFAT